MLTAEPFCGQGLHICPAPEEAAFCYPLQWNVRSPGTNITQLQKGKILLPPPNMYMVRTFVMRAEGETKL